MGTSLETSCRIPPAPPHTPHTVQAVLFEEEGFKCQSRYNNQIAFSVDIALLLKARGGEGAPS